MKACTHLGFFLSKLPLAGCVLTGSLFATVSLNAQTVWTGTTSNAWNVGSNWSPSTVPGNTVEAQLGAAANTSPITVATGASQPKAIRFLSSIANDVTVQLASGSTGASSWRLIAAGAVGAGVFVDSGTAHNATIDLNGGTILFGQGATNGAKYVSITNNGTGTLTLSSGNLDMTATTSSSAVTMNLSFDGTGSVNVSSSMGQQSGSTGAQTYNIKQAGTGTTTLSGANTYNGTTAVIAGKLFVNGTHDGGAAYTVSGTGLLGGSGAITTANNAGITVSAGARLSAGAENSVGTLTMNLGTGSFNVSAALAGDSASLLFDLGAVGSSDKVLLGTGTTLNIGTNVLNFGDFVFTTTTGFGSGVYTLFESSTTIAGTLLSGQLSGTIDGLDGVLSLSGDSQSILLTVTAIPEPANVALLFGGVCGACVIGGRRRRRHRIIA